MVESAPPLYSLYTKLITRQLALIIALNRESRKSKKTNFKL